jgi:uncharacterized C2H2 Zn-finger protein
MPTYRCPDCGQIFQDPSALTDHALGAHVQPGAQPARVERRSENRLVVWGLGALGVIVGVLFWGGLALGILGVFDKETVAQTPGSTPHKVAVELERSGAIDEYRAVEPDDGWDVEYELAGGDGLVREKVEGGTEEVEYQAFDGNLEAKIEEALRKRGFNLD